MRKALEPREANPRSRRGQTNRVLLIAVASSLAGATAGYIAASEVAGLAPGDLGIIIRGATVEVHAVDLRETIPGAAVPQYTMTAWAAAQTADGGAYDMGSVACQLDDAGQAMIDARLNTLGARTCAAGDSGVAPGLVDVHGIDLRRAVNPDAGADLVLATAYGNYDGGNGSRIYLRGYPCAAPPANALAFIDSTARGCFMKAKGLAQ